MIKLFPCGDSLLKLGSISNELFFACLQQQSKWEMSWQIQLNKALPVVAFAGVYSKVVALLLCINYFCSHSLWGLCVISLFWFAVLCDLYSFEVNLLEKRNMFDMPLLGSSCHVAAVVLSTFIRAPSAGLKYVIVTLSM